ncbi:MAG TPA: hypothetical protein PKV41_00595 [Candidatus Omnitrophota bacterium]|nr:hypothetical protein [Candidatus Omnitrophota bacterium]
MKVLGILCSLTFLTAQTAFAAVGCTLNDPDRDIKRIFPQSTGYRTEFITIEERGGEPLAQKIQERLGDRFDPVYESLDVPYAYYHVMNGKDVIGYVHGVNQKGMYGGMQLILALDLEGKIVDFYYQRISSPEAKKFRDLKFTGAFVGLTLEDFLKADLLSDAQGNPIRDPSEKNAKDFTATVRGLKKNLILSQEFIFSKGENP